jgi:hypothetical protein
MAAPNPFSTKLAPQFKVPLFRVTPKVPDLSKTTHAAISY